MDLGKIWRGNRLLGDGKTWRGFIGGTLIGIMVGVIEIVVSDSFSDDHFGFGSTGTAFAIVVALSVGSMSGDVLGAFVKRRLGLERGEKAPFLDQYDFVAGALLFALVVDSAWIADNLIYDDAWIGLIFFLFLVYLIHRAVNIIGYKMGKKDVPW
jgi:CDP-2,3-bis-(O-geranylgeranyl)-sn-glycerol synthase